MNSDAEYLDGNSAAGEASRIFAIDVTAAGDSVRSVERPGVCGKHIYTSRVVYTCRVVAL
jgi:hypothetical protein